MKKFNKCFVAGKTCVQRAYTDPIDKNWYLVKSVHETRNWIEIEGWVGSFQRADIRRFTNKKVKIGTAESYFNN